MRKEVDEIIKMALQDINPFMIRTETGAMVRYKNSNEAYRCCLNAIYKEFPAGFVDIALFMMKYQRLSPATVNSILTSREYCYIRLSELNGSEEKEKLRYLLRLLLSVSGCRFDDVAFWTAVDALVAQIKKEGTAKVLSSLNNIIVL